MAYSFTNKELVIKSNTYLCLFNFLFLVCDVLGVPAQYHTHMSVKNLNHCMHMKNVKFGM